MKLRLFLCLLLVTIHLQIFAQPGPLFIHSSLNFNAYSDTLRTQTGFTPNYRIFENPHFDTPVIYSFYIDSSTDLSRLKYLSLDEIELRLDYIPDELIEVSDRLSELRIVHPTSTTRTFSMDSCIPFRNLEKIQELKKSMSVHFAGFIIDSSSVISNPKFQMPNPNVELNLVFSNCRIHAFPKSIHCPMVHLIGTDNKGVNEISKNPNLRNLYISQFYDSNASWKLPSELTQLTISNCPEMKNLEFTGAENLVRFKLEAEKALIRFNPEFLKKDLNEIDVNLSASFIPALLQSIQKVDSIGTLRIEYQGAAHFDFKNTMLKTNELFLSASYSAGSETSFSGLQNISAKTVFINAPIEKHAELDRIQSMTKLSVYTPAFKHTHETNEFLRKVKGLESLVLSGDSFTRLPQAFFQNNPNLSALTIQYTLIPEIDFGEEIAVKLRTISLRNNYLLEQIPDARHYPNATFSLLNDVQKLD